MDLKALDVDRRSTDLWIFVDEGVFMQSVHSDIWFIWLDSTE